MAAKVNAFILSAFETISMNCLLKKRSHSLFDEPAARIASDRVSRATRGWRRTIRAACRSCRATSNSAPTPRCVRCGVVSCSRGGRGIVLFCVSGLFTRSSSITTTSSTCWQMATTRYRLSAAQCVGKVVVRGWSPARLARRYRILCVVSFVNCRIVRSF
jgi:hypothetical protein